MEHVLKCRAGSLNYLNRRKRFYLKIQALEYFIFFSLGFLFKILLAVSFTSSEKLQISTKKKFVVKKKKKKKKMEKML